MPFLIQRRTPGEERPSYWGREEYWITASPRTRFSQVGEPQIPRGAARYERHEVAHDVAEALRMKNLEHGVVIAVISEPEHEGAACSAAK